MDLEWIYTYLIDLDGPGDVGCPLNCVPAGLVGVTVVDVHFGPFDGVRAANTKQTSWPRDGANRSEAYQA